MKICLNILYLTVLFAMTLTARDPFLFYIHPCKPPLSDAKLRNAWVEELGTEITDDTWEAILIKIYNSSINVRHRLIQFKIVHRLHYTKSRLHAIYLNVSAVRIQVHLPMNCGYAPSSTPSGLVYLTIYQRLTAKQSHQTSFLLYLGYLCTLL